MASSSMLHVRLDDEVKAKGNEVLEEIGLTASDAVRILYKRLIADQAFPLELKAPNAMTRAAMADAQAIIRDDSARFATVDDLIADLDANSRS